MKNSFILYSEHYEYMEDLTMEQRGLLLTAIFEYETAGTVGVELDTATKIVFKIMRTVLDANAIKYAAVVNANKANGSKGGRPKKEKTENNPNKANGFYENPKKPDNDSVSEYDNDSDNESESPLLPKGETTPAPIESNSNFIPPTAEEVRTYCQERRYGINPERFIAVNQAKGWMIGRTKMQDWKAAVESWVTNGYDNSRDPPKQDVTRVEYQTFDPNTFFEKAVKSGMRTDETG